MTRVANYMQEWTHYIHVGGMLTALDDELATTATITFNKLQLTSPTNIANVTIPYTYRYGFNGQERETAINQSVTSAEYWFYDGRLGRRWNVDPVDQVNMSNYSVLGNSPIWYNDVKGDKGTIKTYIVDSKGNKQLVSTDIDNESYLLVKGSYYKTIDPPTKFFKPYQELITFTEAYDYVQEVTIQANGTYVFGEKKKVGTAKSRVEGDLFANMLAINKALEKDGIQSFLPKFKESNPTRNASDFEAFLLANIDQDELQKLIDAFSSGLNKFQDNVNVSPSQYEKYKIFRQKLLERKTELEKSSNKNKVVHCKLCVGNYEVDENGNPTTKESDKVPTDTINNHGEKVQKK